MQLVSRVSDLGLRAALLLASALIALVAVPAGAVPPLVKTVPWVAQNALIPHDTWSGNAIRLKGTADVQGANIQYSWDPGDGGPAITGTVTNRYAIEAIHTYTGNVDQQFTARLRVTNTTTAESSEEVYRVAIREQNLATEVNVAIDEGLWYLHKTQQRSTVSGVDLGDWRAGGQSSGPWWSITASNVQAFEVSGHLESGPTSDPYTETVGRGLRSLFGALTTRAIASQTNGLGTFNPDVNGNGYGVEVNEPFHTTFYDPYQGGMIMDAIVASGTPAAVTTTGPVAMGADPGIRSRTYGSILQDMVDWYAYCQSDTSPGGGWRYQCQDPPDNSANQWAAIGLIAAERDFGATVPQIVKDWNVGWINYSQASSVAFNGSCGYTTAASIWGPYATTPSCGVQMAMDGIGRGDDRWDRLETFLRDRFGNTGGATNAIRDYYYGLFSFVKSMLLHDSDGDSSAEPLPLLRSTNGGNDPGNCADPLRPVDWYEAEVASTRICPGGDPWDGVARTLVNDQNPSGYWSGHNVSGDQFAFETGWAVIMLRRTIVQPTCVVVLSAVPDPGEVNQPITLDCSQSFHRDPERSIVAWDWDLDGDGEFDDASGPVTTTSYPTLGVFPAACRATDSGEQGTGQNVLTCTGSVDVRITIPPIAPTAEAGGPYLLCSDRKPWFLDGTGSVNPDDGASEPGQPGDFIQEYAWDLDDRDGSTSTDATGAQPNVTDFFTALGRGDYRVSLKVTDNTAASFPISGLGDLMDTDTAEVRVRDATEAECLQCEIVLTAEVGPAGTLEVRLEWTDTGGAGYNVYRSTAAGGPYAQIGSSSQPNFVDSDVMGGVTYYYVVRETRLNGDEICQSSEASATPIENQPPICTDAVPVAAGRLWPPNHKLIDVSVTGVTDPDGDPITISITGIAQDEAINDDGDGNTCPDGEVPGGNLARVRNERSGLGDGRVYHVSFTAQDDRGGECTGEVAVCVPHDRPKDPTCVDQGPLVDATHCPDAPAGMGSRVQELERR